MADMNDPRQQDRTQLPPQGTLPQEEEVVIEDSDPALTAGDPVSGMEEPYGSQVLRMWYEAFILQMQEVDSVLQPLDNPKVIKLAMTIQQNIDKMIQAIQALHAGEYESRGLPPLSDGVGEVEEEVMVEEEPETIEEMRPTPDEAAEGMQSMGLRGKSFTQDVKGFWLEFAKSLISQNKSFGYKSKPKMSYNQRMSVLQHLARRSGSSEQDVSDISNILGAKWRGGYADNELGESFKPEEITEDVANAFLDDVGASAAFREKLQRHTTATAARKKQEQAWKPDNVRHNITPVSGDMKRRAEATDAAHTRKTNKEKRPLPDNVINARQSTAKVSNQQDTGGKLSLVESKISGNVAPVSSQSGQNKVQQESSYSQLVDNPPGIGKVGPTGRIYRTKEKKSYNMKCLCGEQPCACSEKNLKESGNKYPQAGDWIKRNAGSILEACDFLDSISTEDEDGGFNWNERSRQKAYHLFKKIDDIIPDTEFKEKKGKSHNMSPQEEIDAYFRELNVDGGRRAAQRGENSSQNGFYPNTEEHEQWLSGWQQQMNAGGDGESHGGTFEWEGNKNFDMGSDTDLGDSSMNTGSGDPNGMESGNMSEMGNEVAKSFFPVKKFFEVISGEKAFGYQHQEAAQACKSLLVAFVRKALDREGFEIEEKPTTEEQRGLSGYAVHSNLEGVSPRGNLMMSNTSNMKVRSPSNRYRVSSDQDVTEDDVQNFLQSRSGLSDRIQYANEQSTLPQRRAKESADLLDTLRRMEEVNSRPEFQNRSGIGNAWDRARIEASERANTRSQQTGEPPVVNQEDVRNIFELNSRTNKWERNIAPMLRELEGNAEMEEDKGKD